MSPFYESPPSTDTDIPAMLLLEAKYYAMANRRSALRALGERAAPAQATTQQSRSAQLLSGEGNRFSLWRAPLQFAQERARSLIIFLLR